MPEAAFDGTLDGWRAAARAALAAGLAPAQVVWAPADDPQEGLALDPPPAPPGTPPAARPDASPAAPPSVPRRFLALAALVACHRDPERWATLYRVLWRLTRGGEPHLLAVAVDADVLHLTRMAKAIRREVHKMHAFVRFRLVHAADGAEEYVAWFEPEHDVVEAAAALFVRRFANMRWAVLTPRTSVRWDGRALAVGPGVPRRDAPSADALERLWGTYYAHIFNPARVKLHAMRAEMPKRYWRNLPEAPLIAPMVRDAPSRVRRMVEAAAAPRRAMLGTADVRRPAAAAAPDVAHAGPPAPDPLGREPVDADAPAAIAPARVGTSLVYAGTSDWEQDDALGPADAAERLRRYAARYPMAVAESTRRRVFAPALAALWAARSPRGLLFDVYGHDAMLGAGVRPHRLPRAIRDRLPASLAGAERVDGELVPDAVRDAIWERFEAAVAVLASHRKLGVVLLRVPSGFGPTREHAEALRAGLRRIARWDVAVEFEAREWVSGKLKARTDDLIAREGAVRVREEGEPVEPGRLAVVRGGFVGEGAERVHVIGSAERRSR